MRSVASPPSAPSHARSTAPTSVSCRSTFVPSVRSMSRRNATPTTGATRRAFRPVTLSSSGLPCAIASTCAERCPCPSPPCKRGPQCTSPTRPRRNVGGTKRGRPRRKPSSVAESFASTTGARAAPLAVATIAIASSSRGAAAGSPPRRRRTAAGYTAPSKLPASASPRGPKARLVFPRTGAERTVASPRAPSVADHVSSASSSASSGSHPGMTTCCPASAPSASQKAPTFPCSSPIATLDSARGRRSPSVSGAKVPPPAKRARTIAPSSLPPSSRHAVAPSERSARPASGWCVPLRATKRASSITSSPQTHASSSGAGAAENRTVATKASSPKRSVPVNASSRSGGMRAVMARTARSSVSSPRGPIGIVTPSSTTSSRSRTTRATSAPGMRSRRNARIASWPTPRTASAKLPRSRPTSSIRRRPRGACPRAARGA